MPTRPFQWQHWLTLGVIVALIIGVIFFGINVGMGALAGSVILVLANATDESQAIRSHAVGADPDGERRHRADLADREDRRHRFVFGDSRERVVAGTVTGIIAFIAGIDFDLQQHGGRRAACVSADRAGPGRASRRRRRAAGRLVDDRRRPSRRRVPAVDDRRAVHRRARRTPTSASCSGRCWPGACRWPSLRRSGATSCSACCGGSARGGLRRAHPFLSRGSRRARTTPQPSTCPTRRPAPVFAALGAPLPDAAEWPRWIAAADAATRARVAEGDELSIVNLLMFGTSFTREPRMTSRQLDGTADPGRAEQTARRLRAGAREARCERAASIRARAAAVRGSGAAALALDDRSRDEGSGDSCAADARKRMRSAIRAWSLRSVRACIAGEGWRRIPRCA